jgi:hypothetical protein
MGEGHADLVTDPAQEARKRRKAIITTQRQAEDVVVAAAAKNGCSSTHSLGSDEDAASDDDAGSEVAAAAALVSKHGKKKLRRSNETADGKKAQFRYDPDVPMTKEHLTAWRTCHCICATVLTTSASSLTIGIFEQFSKLLVTLTNRTRGPSCAKQRKCCGESTADQKSD